MSNYLKDFMQSVPVSDYNDVKQEIIEQCHITDAIWKNWLQGRTRIPELAKPIIKEIAGNPIFQD